MRHTNKHTEQESNGGLPVENPNNSLSDYQIKYFYGFLSVPEDGKKNILSFFFFPYSLVYWDKTKKKNE